ncbi:Twin-arginine translocation pathway signal [Actinomadura craniellae]|uniref:Twin-arginine translocation pathway signal n=2 Tax=Actinomadura craniellae TaxID=2231787 RepID=A0A365GZM8_9ACTN|nr:Twin-arginine translocation pathway signal [Actinomadura craniellae]
MARRIAQAAGDERAELPALEHLVMYVRRRWESGKVAISERYRMLYAAAFGMDEDELFSVPDPVPDVPAMPTVLPSVPSWDRRAAVAPELVDYFWSQLPGHYGADLFLGPRHLIPTVFSQTRLIGQLVIAAEETVRRELLKVGVAYAALLGWLYQDAGDLDQSGYWRDAALHMAHRSGNHELTAYALANKAMHDIDREDGTAVLDFARAALAGERRLSPKVRVLALQHQAHGYSLLGERERVDRLIDQAAALVDQIDDDRPWGNACRRTPFYLEVQRATCYGRLGLAREAADLWEQIMATMTEATRRDTGVFRARHAAALAAIPEPERVTDIAAETATLIKDTGSARLKRELLTLPRHATGWTDTAPGRDLADILAAIA